MEFTQVYSRPKFFLLGWLLACKSMQLKLGYTFTLSYAPDWKAVQVGLARFSSTVASIY